MMGYAVKILLIFLLLTVGACGLARDDSSAFVSDSFKPVIIDNKNINHRHVTTRPHNRKVIYHQPSGYWFVFYGHGEKDPDGVFRISWRSSKDGVNWSERRTLSEGNSHSSSLDVSVNGDCITLLLYRVQYYRKKAGIPEVINGEHWAKNIERDFTLPYEIQQFTMNDGNLLPGPIHIAIPGSWNKCTHYGSLTQDANGYFWVGARTVIDGEENPFQALVARSGRPNDISEWDKHVPLYRPNARGTVTVQVIALNDGMVFAIIYSKSDAKIFGSVYDPDTENWQKPYIIAEGSSHSKRAVACFDPGTNRLHLVYVNNSNDLMHKILSMPYGLNSWKPGAGTGTSGVKIVSNVAAKPRVNDNISLSIDTSKKPAPLVVAYHKKTPHYFLRYYDGVKWKKKIFALGIHEPNQFADEISLIEDFKDRMGLVYYAFPYEDQSHAIHFIEIPKEKLPTGS